jgi:hypothetical protein
VEIWATDDQGREQYLIATLQDMGDGGIGLRCDTPLTVGQTLAIAIHQPEVTFHGRATVRHCTPRKSGHLVGMAFVFDP